MSDTKPKPRPRPRPVKATSSQENKDDDAFFLRNQTRTTSTWAKLNKLNQGMKAKPHKDDNDEEEEVPKTKPKVPRWQRAKKSILSSGLSDDEDSESSDVLAIDDDDTTPRSKRRKRIENKRRSRSRSITPPPEIPLHQLQSTAKQIRQNLGLDRRPTSPPSDEEEDTPEILVSDPELLNIVKNIRAQSQVPQLSSESQSEDFVTLNVLWKPHPLNEYGQEQKFAYRLTRSDNFRELYEAVADDASVLSDNVIITYRGNRIFSSVTPSALGMWDKADLVACDKVTYEYVREQSRTTVSVPEPLSKNDDEDDVELASETEESTINRDAESDAGISDSDGETFKLTLRSSVTSRDIILTVRPTTKCGAIVQAFLKKAGLANKYSITPKKRKKGGPDPRLSVDGDRIDNETEIGEMDLEDGDLVEVVGL